MYMAFCPHQVGIAIPPEVQAQYPDEIKQAWEIFFAWLEQQMDEDVPIKRSNIPAEVAAAEKMILEAPIPGMNGATGKDSCPMIYAESFIED